MSDLFKRLTTHEALLAIGVSLAIFGLILRTFARSSRRDRALRQQHRLHDRKLGEAIEAEQTEQITSWFEKNLPLIANTVVLAGLAITVISFFRK